jgi:hypothetical protein
LVRVRPLVGGIDGWIAAGHAVEHGIPVTLHPSPRQAAELP